MAFATQLAAHAFSKGASDGQPQASTAIAPGNRAVGLLEGDEHHFQAFAVDADACVAHAAREPQRLTIERLPTRFDLHLAAFSELQGIADQVEEDLADARRVAHHLQPLALGR
ncbi:hypothetical protein D3C78_691190 [compost metagenome]